MSLETLSILTGGTVSVTGGTAQAFTPSGTQIAGGIEVVDASSNDFIGRDRVQAVFRTATVKPDNTKTKMKWSVRKVCPALDDLGNVVYNLIEVRTEIHPDSLAADSTLLDTMRADGAQLAFDSDLDNFYNYGSVS